jgi:tetratricopeptide (TPR) repeat protein
MAFYNRGRIYQKTRDEGNAILDYSKSILLDPSYASACLGRGGCYRNKGEMAKAREDFAQAIKLGYKPR